MDWALVMPQPYDIAYHSAVPKSGPKMLILDGVVSLLNDRPSYFSDYLPAELHGLVDPFQYADFIDDINNCLEREFYFRRRTDVTNKRCCLLGLPRWCEQCRRWKSSLEVTRLAVAKWSNFLFVPKDIQVRLDRATRMIRKEGRKVEDDKENSVYEHTFLWLNVQINRTDYVPLPKEKLGEIKMIRVTSRENTTVVKKAEDVFTRNMKQMGGLVHVSRDQTKKVISYNELPPPFSLPAKRSLSSTPTPFEDDVVNDKNEQTSTETESTSVKSGSLSTPNVEETDIDANVSLSEICTIPALSTTDSVEIESADIKTDSEYIYIGSHPDKIEPSLEHTNIRQPSSDSDTLPHVEEICTDELESDAHSDATAPIDNSNTDNTESELKDSTLDAAIPAVYSSIETEPHKVEADDLKSSVEDNL